MGSYRVIRVLFLLLATSILVQGLSFQRKRGYIGHGSEHAPGHQHYARQTKNISPAHQSPEKAPSIPIIDLSNQYISAATSFSSSSSLGKRAGAGAELCDANTPCADSSCCSVDGVCGYGPTYCGAGNCTSNCDALAMCGRYSDLGGTIACGMNICCSYYGWCGTDENHCGNPDPNGQSPCQEGYGLCEIVAPPSCSTSSGSTDGRSIGYYQGSNTRDRKCDTVSPSQIVLDGYTHLYYAFASIDPTTFEVVPASSDDIAIYKEFTALKSSSLETWIAIGGFDFSDAGPTHTTWSNLSSSATNRAAFISSLTTFMDTYGFQGVDLDWEYPGPPERGGERADTENYVTLVKEISAAFNGAYGLSLTLAPDYWYLRWFDAKAMEPYVDWFGFMAYDLHGSWDADTKTLGSLVRGQADIREIYNDTLPLWFDALTPSKINLGLALYGRGYTLSDPSCNQLLCGFSGPSDAGKCTNYAGVMSLDEIQSVISENNLVPELIESAMMKQITWGDQWIGYDDEETIAMKKSWGNGLCFGGTMKWSVDFNSANGSSAIPSSQVTTDGTCGSANNGTVCGDWSTGNCCSASGWCGSGDSYCGSGCQSGNCTVGGYTTDGTCGTSYRNTLCGDWANGGCCSSAGYCGNDTAHCGTGCQSGPCLAGSGEVIIDSDIWDETAPTVGCYPPCTLVLPPFTLETPVTVTWPPLTTEVLSSTGGSVITKTTVLTIDIFTTSIFSFWPITVTSGDPTTATIFPEQSIMPPSFTITFPGTEISIEETTTSTSGTTTTTIVPPVFFSSSHVVTYQPMPTVSIPTPFPGPPGSIDYKETDPGSACTTGCGSVDCGIFGCGSGCGLFGCFGGCGIFGCIGIGGSGGCGLSGCSGGGSGSGGGGGGGDGESDSCSTMTTATVCTLFVRSSITSGATTYTTSTETVCDVTTDCTVVGSTTTTTITTSTDYGTTTISLGDYIYSTMAAADLTSEGSSLDSMFSDWDASRWGSSTAASTTTTGGSGGSGGSTTPQSTSSSTASTTTPKTTAISTLQCTFGQDPDQSNAGYCQCSGYTGTLPTLTTSNSPCAYTTIPASLTAKPTTSTSAAGNTAYPFTITDAYGGVTECESSTIIAVAGVTSLTECAGSSSILHTRTAGPSSTSSSAPSSNPTPCVEAHTYMNDCIFDGDIMSAQVWADGVLVCSGGQNKNAASSDTVYDISCNATYTFTVTNNGKSGTFSMDSGYSVDLDITKSNSLKTYVCGSSGETDIKGTEAEYCLSNNVGTCGSSSACSLCDYKAKC